jgi:hypothetical protein
MLYAIGSHTVSVLDTHREHRGLVLIHREIEGFEHADSSACDCVPVHLTPEEVDQLSTDELNRLVTSSN